MQDTKDMLRTFLEREEKSLGIFTIYPSNHTDCLLPSKNCVFPS